MTNENTNDDKNKDIHIIQDKYNCIQKKKNIIYYTKEQ